jgi:signal transduction histidine kinase
MLKQIENFRLVTKVVIPTAVMLAVALGIVALAERSLERLTAETHQIIRVTAKRQALALVAEATVNGVAANEKNAMLMTDKAGMDVFATGYVTDMDHLKASIAALEKLAADRGERLRLTQIEGAIAAYAATGAELYDLMVAKRFAEAHALSNGAAQQARERLIALIRQEVAEASAAMQRAAGLADRQYRQTLAALFGFSAAGLIAALFTVGWISKRFIVGPLTRITDAMGRLSEGDLAIAVAGAERRDEIGVLGRALIVFRDQSLALRQNTERLNAADAEIRALNTVLERRVEERTAALQDAQAALLRQERLAALGELTATVAHELRNPLSAIQNSLVVIEETARRAGLDLERPLGRVDRGIARCNGIIGDLLDYTETRALNRVKAMADDWLIEVLDAQQMPPGIRLLPQPGAPGCAIAIDRARMRLVVANLIENAAQAMAEPSPSGAERRIAVTSAESDAGYEIVVEDTGPGIAPEVLPRVFDPLFSTKSFGSGLGLPTVKQIVEQHAGSIALSSEAGRGTRVVIRLPRAALGDIAA